MRGTETDGSPSAKSLSQQTAWKPRCSAPACLAPPWRQEFGAPSNGPAQKLAASHLEGFFHCPSLGGPVQESVSAQLSNKQRPVPEAWTTAGGISSETYVVTKCWHFHAGEGSRRANSMLLQPYRKPAWPSCQPAAVYGPWGHGEGEERRERKTQPYPPKKIDPELFLGAYSSHTFLFKSQDMGSVQKPFSRRRLAQARGWGHL